MGGWAAAVLRISNILLAHFQAVCFAGAGGVGGRVGGQLTGDGDGRWPTAPASGAEGGSIRNI